MDLKIYADKQTVAKEFSKFFYEQAKGVNEFHVSLSGGSTPKLFLIFWQKIIMMRLTGPRFISTGAMSAVCRRKMPTAIIK